MSVKVKVFKGDDLEKDFNSWSDAAVVVIHQMYYSNGQMVVVWSEPPKMDPKGLLEVPAPKFKLEK